MIGIGALGILLAGSGCAGDRRAGSRLIGHEEWAAQVLQQRLETAVAAHPWAESLQKNTWRIVKVRTSKLSERIEVSYQVIAPVDGTKDLADTDGVETGEPDQAKDPASTDEAKDTAKTDGAEQSLSGALEDMVKIMVLANVDTKGVQAIECDIDPYELEYLVPIAVTGISLPIHCPRQ